MRRSFLVLLFCSVCFATGISYAEWFDLRDDQHYVDDFSLNPGENRVLTIESEEEVWIGFYTDISVEQSEKYKDSAYPIKVSNEERGSISSTFGGATIFRPVDGKIDIAVSNNSKDDTIRVVIYTQVVEE